MCIHVGARTQECTRARTHTWRPEADIRCLPQELSALCFETRPLTEPELTDSATLAVQQTPRILLSLPPSIRTTDHSAKTSSCVGTVDLNLGPRATRKAVYPQARRQAVYQRAGPVLIVVISV